MFFDPNQEVLGTLGLFYHQDVLRLLDGKTSPGYMPIPEPSAVILLGTAAIGLLSYGTKIRRTNSPRQ